MEDSKALRTIRELAGLNQHEAARRFGIHPMTWTKRELGSYPIPQGFLSEVWCGLEEEIRGRVDALWSKPEEVAVA